MKRRLSAWAGAICLVSALAGCSSPTPEERTTFRTVGTEVLSALRARRAQDGPAPFAQITAEQLDNTKVPALQVNILERGGSDFLRRIAQRDDETPGTVSVWRASDGGQIFLRDGVLIGTRGVGNDIISSNANATVAAVRGARAGNGQRTYRVSQGDFSDQSLILSCDIENLGAGTTQIVNRSYRTVHLRESCVGGAADRVRIVNDYWVQPENGLVRRSKQWVGPAAGYFEMLLLKN